MRCRLRANRTVRMLNGDRAVDPMRCLFIRDDLPDLETYLEGFCRRPIRRVSPQTGKWELEKAPDGTESPDDFDSTCLAFVRTRSSCGRGDLARQARRATERPRRRRGSTTRNRAATKRRSRRPRSRRTSPCAKASPEPRLRSDSREVLPGYVEVGALDLPAGEPTSEFQTQTRPRCRCR